MDTTHLHTHIDDDGAPIMLGSVMLGAGLAGIGTVVAWTAGMGIGAAVLVGLAVNTVAVPTIGYLAGRCSH